MKRKGFTLVELLVVIGIIALLMSILMPTLTKVRQLANRIVCGTNLSGIGKAMMMYANENDEDYPRAGGKKSVWDTDGEIVDWKSERMEKNAFGSPPGAKATITSSLYLLIRTADVTPKQFICKGDRVEAFELSLFSSVPADFEITDAWDFGGDSKGMPGEFCSYSYHSPYNVSSTVPGYPVTASSNSGSPLCADRNPYLDEQAYAHQQDADVKDTDNFYCDDADGFVDRFGHDNSAAHQFDGQNVLYNDSHVKFEKYANVGIENDNIWKYWSTVPPANCDREMSASGEPTGIGAAGEVPQNSLDAYLVNEAPSGTVDWK